MTAALWPMICEAAPSAHLRGAHAEQVAGFRRYLAAAALRHRPLRYLEIGVRLGHSFALVVATAQCEGELDKAIGVDWWIGDYADERNPGAGAVLELLLEVGAGVDQVSLLQGDSHELLPELLAAGERFNLVLVDGDHEAAGARQDLEVGFAMLEAGGELVFDDVVYDGDDGLLEVWRQFIAELDVELEHGIDDSDAGVPAFAWLRRSA